MNQAKEWQQLRDTLNAERTGYHDFLSLLIEEHRFLRCFDSGALLDIAGRKHEALTGLMLLERDRWALCRILTGVTMSADPSSLSLMSSYESSPLCEMVKHAFAAMVSVARAVAKQGRDNAVLVHRGLAIVREALRLIYVEAGLDPVYGDGGTLTFPTVTSSLNVVG